MSSGIRLRGVSKRYGRTEVLRDIDLDLAPGHVYGLLGANGVGKTTLMSVICNHQFRTAGTIVIDGQDPAENAPVLEQICFIHEDQRWHDEYRVADLLRAAPLFFPRWNQEQAEHLLRRFSLPRRTKCKKLSRGQRSALAIILSIASHAPYTFLDEPYLGLDATARTMFYEELIRAQADDPRTITMSTHLIDEAAHLMEEVVLMRAGRIDSRQEVDEVTSGTVMVRGRREDVDAFTVGREVLATTDMGTLRSALLRCRLEREDRRRAEQAHLAIEPANLQEIVAALGILTDTTSPSGPAADPHHPQEALV